MSFTTKSTLQGNTNIYYMMVTAVVKAVKRHAKPTKITIKKKPHTYGLFVSQGR